VLLEKVLQQFALALGVHRRFFVSKVARLGIAAELLLKRLTQIRRPGDLKNLFVSIKKLENAFDRGHGCHMLLIEIQPRFRCFNDQVIVPRRIRFVKAVPWSGTIA
jgi:hypothetical protein